MESLIGICGCVNSIEDSPCGDDTIPFKTSFHNPNDQQIVSKVSKDDSLDTSKTPELELDRDNSPSPQKHLDLGSSFLPHGTSSSNKATEKTLLPTLEDDFGWPTRPVTNFRSFDTVSSNSGTLSTSSGFIRTLNEDIGSIPQFKLHRRTKSVSDIPDFERKGKSKGTTVIKRKRLIATGSSSSSISLSTSNATSTRSFDDSPSSTVTGISATLWNKKIPSQQQPLPHHSPPPRSPNSKRRFVPISSHSPTANDLTHPLSTVERCAEDVPPWIIDIPDTSSTQIPLMPMSMLMPKGQATSTFLKRRPPLPPSPPTLKRMSRYEEEQEERIVFDLTLLEREDRLRKLRDSLSFGSDSFNDTGDEEEEQDGKQRVNLNRRHSISAHSPARTEDERLMGESIAFSASDDEDDDLAGIEFLSHMLDIDGDEKLQTHHRIPQKLIVGENTTEVIVE